MFRKIPYRVCLWLILVIIVLALVIDGTIIHGMFSGALRFSPAGVLVLVLLLAASFTPLLGLEDIKNREIVFRKRLKTGERIRVGRDGSPVIMQRIGWLRYRPVPYSEDACDELAKAYNRRLPDWVPPVTINYPSHPKYHHAR